MRLSVLERLCGLEKHPIPHLNTLPELDGSKSCKLNFSKELEREQLEQDVQQHRSMIRDLEQAARTLVEEKEQCAEQLRELKSERGASKRKMEQIVSELNRKQQQKTRARLERIASAPTLNNLKSIRPLRNMSRVSSRAVLSQSIKSRIPLERNGPWNCLWPLNAHKNAIALVKPSMNRKKSPVSWTDASVSRRHPFGPFAAVGGD